jgi:hypothetical protein
MTRTTNSRFGVEDGACAPVTRRDRRRYQGRHERDPSCR